VCYELTVTDDTHTTLGRRFRVPAHPDVLTALGRATYSFLAIEETVTAILAEAGYCNLAVARGMMAGQKESALRLVADGYRGASDAATADALVAGADAFRDIRKGARNELLHAHPFTAGKDEKGAYMPGLGYTIPDGSSWKTLTQTPDDLLDLATTIEGAITPLTDAREAVAANPLPGSQT
jgi:hypothetical protein